MKVAISTDGAFVSEHFGRCPSFTLLEINGKNIVNKEVIDNPGHHPGFLPEFLHKRGVEHIIAGGMGQRALVLFEQNGIKPILGISGKIDEVIKQLLEGTLKGGESLCNPGAGKGYGVEKTECDHSE
ncbi:MAG: NifB/NifX family molybdenum-iron cluster-binding protein [Endomicrobiales bacterium]|nr:NifB/NifX family molybdenum-iron cluster-binding protein [Endomicrobiales bacterium]